jgi:hypothetical protein
MRAVGDRLSFASHEPIGDDDINRYVVTVSAPRPAIGPRSAEKNTSYLMIFAAPFMLVAHRDCQPTERFTAEVDAAPLIPFAPTCLIQKPTSAMLGSATQDPSPEMSADRASR